MNALNKPVFASGEAIPNWNGQKVYGNDGDLTTRWLSMNLRFREISEFLNVQLYPFLVGNLFLPSSYA
jgi:hypothetical protein